ncbi:MAG: O-antigen ligase [Bacteroidia bacterium]|jgi:O-antigen ligase
MTGEQELLSRFDDFPNLRLFLQTHYPVIRLGNSLSKKTVYLLLLTFTVFLIFQTGEWGFLLIPYFLLLWEKKHFDVCLISHLFLLVADNHDAHWLDFINNLKVISLVTLSLLLLYSELKDWQGWQTIFSKQKVLLYFLPFLLTALLTTFSSEFWQVGSQKLIAYGLSLWLIPPLFQLAYQKNRERVIQLIIGFIAFVLLFGLVLQFFDSNLTHTVSRFRGLTRPPRFNGIFANPNGLAIFGMLSFVLAFVSFQKNRNIFKNWVWGLIFGIMLFSVFQTRSRTEFLSLTGFLFVWRFPKVSLFVIPIGILGIAFFREEVLILASETIYFLHLEDILRPETLTIGGGRFHAYELAWNEIHHSLFFGEGWGLSHQLMITNGSKLKKLGHYGNLHQSYLTVLLNTGLVGLLAFLAGWSQLFFQSAKENWRLGFAVLVAVAVSTSLESWLVSAINPFTSLLLILLQIIQNPQEHAHQE